MSNEDREMKAKMTKATARSLGEATRVTVRKVTIFFQKRTGLVEFSGGSQVLLEQAVDRLLRERPAIKDHKGMTINVQRIRPFEKGSGKRGRE